MSQYRAAPFTMLDILPLLQLAQPSPGRTSYNQDCPFCGDRKKHLNINLAKNVFKCPRCGSGGGVLALYAAVRGCTNQEAYEDIRTELRIDSFQGKTKTVSVSAPPQCQIAGIDTRHAAYTRLLGALALEERHRTALIARGLSDEAIQKAAYRSYPHVFHEKLARMLQDAGCGPEGIPGFYIENGRRRLVEKPPGFLIPVRDMEGHIQGLQIRLDDARKRKYRWVSSAEMHYGCGADGSCVHIAGKPGRAAIITEGPLKADIIHEKTGICALGIVGVSGQKYLPELLARLKSKGLERAYLAFDMDFLSNEQVIREYDRLRHTVSEADIPYSRLIWNAVHKGLDDYLTGVPGGARAIRAHIQNDIMRRNDHDHSGGSRQFGDQDGEPHLPFRACGEPDRAAYGGQEHLSKGTFLDTQRAQDPLHAR